MMAGVLRDARYFFLPHSISDFSLKVPFICDGMKKSLGPFPICPRMVRIHMRGRNSHGPFKIACEWSAYTCRKISRPVTKTPGKCPLIGESKDSFAQPCGKCPVSSEGISISTTKAQKENGYGKKDIR